AGGESRLFRRSLLILAFLSASPPARLPAQNQAPGKATYDKWCAGCHGETGAGDGEAAAYMLPRPRDFTKGTYQIRSTASGSLPTDADLRHVIDEGMPGTAMPGWKAKLSERERNDLVAYLKTFSRFFETTQPEEISLGKGAGTSDATIADGREAWRKLECFKCHGEGGRGDGTSAPTLTDDLDFPIRAADLTEPWTFNGGNTVEQIYARLRTGLDGTPMPSFSDAIESNVITDEQLWHVAQYVRSLSPEKPPVVREVIRAHRADSLPSAPSDSAWNEVEAFYIPLVGQIIKAPRWFTNSIDGIWVRAMHDGQQLAIRVSWSDPSKSPDPGWQEWVDRMSATVFRDDSTALANGSDWLALQFPEKLPDDAERPYFLGGSARRPVYLWRWSSEPDRVQEGSQKGLGQFSPGSTSQVIHAARFHQGEWQVQFNRSLVPSDTGSAPAFRTGTAIPIAFYAADGSNGEDVLRGAVSAWYAIYLDVPTPGRVYVQPIVAVLLTAGLGLFVIIRAQRRERRAVNFQAEEP
ncbi:MAG TPA: c-type cytochrome, partial [Gemmatimonadales bacterium]|nr:c-type cytochrome [Gemmatimonadales bacterium]